MATDEPQGITGARQLRESTLGTFAARVDVPTYRRDGLKQAIVHIGVGGFHRAHQAVYLDDLAERHIADDWGETGVGLLPQDKLMQEALVSQQCLYTVVERGAHQDRARVVGSMTRYLFAPESPARVLDVLANAQTRLVTLTITEGGYNFNQITGDFEAQNRAIQHDLHTPSSPSTVFGYLCEALDRRRKAGLRPFTVQSCDNLQGNGAVARRTILAYASLRDEALSTWIAAHVAFPSSMVDRITPQTTERDREMVATTFGIEDAWPVVTEPFMQWIVEDTFCNGRPPLEEAGVQYVTDVHPYEMMKIRLLNASHQAMAYLGYLCGYRYIHDIMGDTVFREYIERMMDEEVSPLLPPVPGVDLAEYKRTLVERFANPKIGDQVARICQDASARMPKFLLPSVSESLAARRPCRLLTLAVAGWFRFLRGVDEQGAPIAIQDPMAETLHALAVEGGDDPHPLLSVHSLFGDLAQQPAFVASLHAALRDLTAQGARATLSRYLASDDA